MSGERASSSEGSSSMSFWSAAAALSSPVFAWTAYDTGRVCCAKGGRTIGAAGSHSVSPVCASLSFMRTTNSPGPASGTSAVCAPSVRCRWVTRSSLRVRGFITVASCFSVPEKTRT